MSDGKMSTGKLSGYHSSSIVNPSWKMKISLFFTNSFSLSTEIQQRCWRLKQVKISSTSPSSFSRNFVFVCVGESVCWLSLYLCHCVWGKEVQKRKSSSILTTIHQKFIKRVINQNTTKVQLKFCRTWYQKIWKNHLSFNWWNVWDFS